MNQSVISRPMGGFAADVDVDFIAGAQKAGPRLVVAGRRGPLFNSPACCGGFERVKVRNGRFLATVTCTCAESTGAAA